MAADGNQIRPPFSPPDCPWVSITEGTKIPDNAYKAGTLDGDPVYIGRVFDDGCYLVGTALPNKGICLYLSKKLEKKSTSSYDILTVDCGEPLCFEEPKEINSRLLFVSGGDEEVLLYCSRVKDGDHTYIGWSNEDLKTAYIPRDPVKKLTENYTILIHQFLDRLCICPPAPMPPF